MKILAFIKKVLAPIIRYLLVFIPISGLMLFLIMEYGDELGIYLIDQLGPVYGLFIRPIVIVVIPMIILGVLSLPIFDSFNRYLWLKRLNKEQISFIYKSHLYSLGSFALLTLTIILMTLFISHTEGVNWYTAKQYVFYYLLLVLFGTPILHVIHLGNQKGMVK